MVYFAATGRRKYEMLILLIPLLLVFSQDLSQAVKITEMRVPKHAVKDRPVRLECLYDLEGETLYAVKWYKDGLEFYRYVPRDEPPARIFPQRGLNVKEHESTDNHVTLESIGHSASGKYRCEVSGEAPAFETVASDADMMVVVLPEKDPVISGGRPRYQLGEYVRVNCTSGRSKPAVQLMWYINSELADPTYVRQYPTIVSLIPDHLETSILGLEFRVKPKHFRHGDMKLKCLATISTVYWKSNEESVESDKPQKAPILESRKSGLTATTRADRVQAGNGSTTGFSPQQNLPLMASLSILFNVVARSVISR
uniref:Ig-like domain-containing protein n=1 Tax=Anopheles atroparvus TaxID=41427 RepID=A0AAG5CV02_ANOAO